tara:strand:+ start:14740 stop:15000 length:261 start_codon:yes stop_codon:yes gene_type:complete
MYQRLEDNKNYTKAEICQLWDMSITKFWKVFADTNSKYELKPARLGKVNIYRGIDLNIYYDDLFKNVNNVRDRSPFDELKKDSNKK